MARRYDDDEEEEELEEEEEEVAEEDDEDYEELDEEGDGKRKRKYRRSEFIDDVAEEDDDEEEEEDERPRKRKSRPASQFFDDIAAVASDDDEEEEEGEEDFINDVGTDLPEEEGRAMHRRPFLPREDEQDVEDLERLIQEKYGRSAQSEYDEETTDVEQQALLPSVKDPKLWMVKCAIGHEREVAVCLMQKYLDLQSQGNDLQIRSVIALDHLKNYIYVEADREAHVKEAIKGLRNIFSSSKVMLVPIKEMTDVLSVESKSVELSKDKWVRVKLGTYKGDLAKVVDVDNVRQRVTIKLLPRIDLQALANKLEGKEVGKKKTFVPPPRRINMREIREMNFPVERKWDPVTGLHFETVDNNMIKDGYLYKVVSVKSITSQISQPTLDELEKFGKSGDDASGDMASLSSLFANRKKGHFVKGDAVVVVQGDLINLKGRVEKVEEDNVHIRANIAGLPETLCLKERELCKYFEPGDHVKVVTGAHEGATGMVIKTEGHNIIIISDTTKEDIKVFSDHVVASSEVTSGLTKLGNYELHDLVLLDDKNFGVIIRVESEAFHVLKGIPDRAEVVLIRLREIKDKIEKRMNAQDKAMNTVSPKDVVRICDGPCRGKQGPVEHIYKGVLFIHDRHHLENAGYICVKSQSCVLVGGSRGGIDMNGKNHVVSRFNSLRASPNVLQSPRRPPRGPSADFGGGRNRGGRGRPDSLIGTTVKIHKGPYKGYRGRVKDVHGTSVRVELDSIMKVVSVDRDQISDTAAVATPYRDSHRYGLGSETPMHPSRTPMHPTMTPMRDPGATPIHDGMRTPMRDRAWNPYAPMSPARDNWEDGNPGSWGSAASPRYQPGTPARPYEAPTPGSGWAPTPAANFAEAGTPRESTSAYANAPSPYLPSTPGGQPMTPSSAAYLPGTPGGQPMTPGNVGLDMMSPAIGGEGEGQWFLPDILVNVRKSGDDPQIGVVREVLMDGSCKVSLGASGNREMVTAHPTDLEIIVPKKNDRIKIMSGSQRGVTGKLIGIDGTDGIVKVDDTLDIKILDMVILAKLAPQ
ncbi:putative transcription elongation factor SPT5 homolog 1 [Nymphaea colorata]|nr:putative transcription elongation factor SPT5 homolog 1 [Nymphaea colorata]